ncbi:MAG: SDR family NAD(P)-dependent oxidoreductase, partial [Propionibacteriaceae bacterium]|nr:SDR family NAD(P)-dependent oxidoreductase [Propionibacteriaceae bacterium]
MTLSSLFDLTGRSAFLIGGATGIGFAAARLLKEAGATVYLAGRRTEVGAQAAGELDATFIQVDV